MNYLVKILLSLCCLFVTAGAAASTHNFGSFTQNQSYANSVDTGLLEQEVSARMERVAEFKFIKQVAAKYDVDIYLFGGTASAYAHYVRWDMLRENGDPRFQPERFDYFFDNIYRSNQDLDIVVDSDEETAKKIASELKQKFNHFVGNKEAWEVRLLRKKTGDKLPLIDDPDFANQHTDSNSIGVIKVNGASHRSFYDLGDWDNKQSLYLKDVASASMTYLFSGKHETTSRYKEGKNPPILSAIRYLAKATQYELTLKEQDLKKVEKVIKSTKVEDLSSYSKKKLSEFALKTLLNSPDVEYAWNLLEKTGARKLAIEADSNQINEQNSISWWLSKEPLRSKAVGTGNGKTAKELGIDIVAHETNSFRAFDNITRSTQGKPNVFISRSSAVGEAAAHGEGFYTKVGKEGARGTGITIRFKVHPEAIEGVDFIKKGEYIIFNNKNTLELMPEKININIVEYFKLLSAGEITDKDKGLANRIKNRFNKMTKPSKSETNQIERIVKSIVMSGHQSFIVEEWLSLKVSTSYPSLLDLIIKKEIATQYIAEHVLSQEYWAQHPKGADLLMMLIRDNKVGIRVARSVMSKQYWAKHKRSVELIDEIIKHPFTRPAVVKYVLSQEYWSTHKKGFEFVLKLLAGLESRRTIVNHVLSKEYWVKKANAMVLLEALILSSDVGHEIAQSVLSQEYWVTHKRGAEFVEILIKKGSDSRSIARYVLSQKHWAEHPRGEEFLEMLIQEGSSDRTIVAHVLSKEYWAKNPIGVKFLEELIEGGKVDDLILENVLSNKYWAKHPKGPYFLKRLVKNVKVFSGEAKSTLSQKHWAEHPMGIEILTEYMKNTLNVLYVAKYFLSEGHWSRHPESAELLESAIKMNRESKSIAEHVFSKKYWAEHPRGAELFEMLIRNVDYDSLNSFISDTILEQKHWVEHPDYNRLKELLAMPMGSKRQKANKGICASMLGGAA